MLYILMQAAAANGDQPEWKPWYDKLFKAVVRAETEQQARSLASECAGEEGKSVWLDPAKTSCAPLDHDGEPGVLCVDFARP